MQGPGPDPLRKGELQPIIYITIEKASPKLLDFKIINIKIGQNWFCYPKIEFLKFYDVIKIKKILFCFITSKLNPILKNKDAV